MAKPSTRQPSMAGAPRRFTRADVVAAGVAIVAADGFGAVSLSAVADRMGTRRTTLYHYFPSGLHELHTAIVDYIDRELTDDPAAAGSVGAADPGEHADLFLWPQQTAARIGRASRDYPGFLQYLLTSGSNERATVLESDRLLQALAGSDLSPLTAEAWVIIHAYITGWVSASRPTAKESAAQGFTELSDALTEAEKLDPDDVLLDGLQALLSGLRLRILADSDG